MKLSPECLRTYAPEEMDAMKWEEAEASITLWIRHLELAGQTPFAVKEQLCRDVLGPS